jgi:nitrogen-specific signal transduction histidine kinase
MQAPYNDNSIDALAMASDCSHPSGLMNTEARPCLADVTRAVASTVRFVELMLARGVGRTLRCIAPEEQTIIEQARLLANRLLTLTGPEQDAIQLVSVRETIMAMAGLLHCTAGPWIDLHIDVDRELPPLICSPCDLENVVLNLVASARDAMPSGGELGMSAHVDQRSLGEHFEEQYVVLRIEAAYRGEMDAQIGLDASTELPLIRLLDEELSPDVAMAREFAWQLGGAVEITSIARTATTTALRLPARIAKASAKVHAEARRCD